MIGCAPDNVTSAYFLSDFMLDLMLFVPAVQPSAVLAVSIAAFAVGMLKDLFIYGDS